ncbi:MAG: ATP-binding cassette domain-containing protein [Flavonifractor plautii]
MSRYHADKEVLHDVSLTIPAGSMTAFVGPSGSGKSTIAKLIAGFRDVTSGPTLGGQDLKRVPLKQFMTRWPLSPDNYPLTRVSGKYPHGPPGATDAEVEAVARPPGARLIRAWNAATTPWWAEAAPIVRRRTPATPSPGPC